MFQQNGTSERNRYFDPQSLEKQPLLSGAEYYEEFKRTFVRILLDTFAEGGKWLSLTGGLDGRLIMAWACRPEKLPCYTFGGSYHDCTDVRIARK